MPLTLLPLAVAGVVVSLLSYAAVVASMFLAHRVFYPRPAQTVFGRANDLAILLVFAVIPMYSYPFLAALMLYVPFMLAVPQLSHHYALVCLLIMLPAICWLWANRAASAERRILLLITCGLVLSQFPSYAVERLLIESFGVASCAQAPRSWACLPNAVPGIGLALVMMGCVAYKAWAWRLPRLIA